MTPHPLHLLDNAVYALPLRDGGWLLIDAGPDFEGEGAAVEAGTWELAVAQAAALGFAPADVRAVLVTHGHIDHAGLAARWADAGARILVGRADIPAVAGGWAWQQAGREWRLRELARHGCPQAILDEFGTWGRGATMAGWRWEPCPRGAITAVEDGAEFALAGGAVLRVVAAPGHTPGNLVAHIEASGELLTGDTLLPGTIPTPGLHALHPPGGAASQTGSEAPPAAEQARWPSLPPFVASVARLRALFAAGAVRRVLPGHGQPVEGAQAIEALLGRFEAHRERRTGRVRALLSAAAPARTSDTSDISAYELARGLFPRLPEARTGQAMTEVIGHLDVLVGSGAAVAVAKADGAIRYAPTASVRA